MNNRIPPQPISLQDLKDYLKEDSSFAFEMQVREIFASKGLRFDHGGTYADPHTELPRQFDLQVVLNCNLWRTPLQLFIAIECKCLSEFAPMLVYRSPRSVYEAGHQLIATTSGDRDKVIRELKADDSYIPLSDVVGSFPRICTLDLPPRSSQYQSNEHVGKAVDIIGKDGNGKFRAGDKDIYGRWTQALQSISSMMESLRGDYFEAKPFMINWFLPILAIPDNRLFVVDFDNSGKQLGDPQSERQTSFFVDYSPPGLSIDGPKFKIGHLEIVTYSALKDFVSRATASQSQRFFDSIINERACRQALSRF